MFYDVVAGMFFTVDLSLFILILRVSCHSLFAFFGFFFFKQKTAYEMRISDWSSDVCSSDLYSPVPGPRLLAGNDAHTPSLQRELVEAMRREAERLGPSGRASCRERGCPYV